MQIYGAGMAGLLAGNVLRRFSPVIFEAQDQLPNNHAALLRFRSDIASRATNIPFKKVSVQKLIDVGGEVFDRPNLKFTNMYSQKVTDKVMGRSINNLDPVERYIAPPHFIGQMSEGLRIEYNSPMTKESLAALEGNSEPIISTIPMNVMMKLADWPNMPEFKFNTIWSAWGRLEKPSTEVYQTVYYPDPDDPFYRVSITGDIVIAEYITEPTGNIGEELTAVLEQSFGIKAHGISDLQIKQQYYGKLLPIDDKERKEFIIYLTDKYRIYSLGRFATWRQILLDDIVDDVKIIEQMIEHRDDYSRKLLANGVRK